MPRQLTPVALEVLRTLGLVCGVIAMLFWLRIMLVARHSHINRTALEKVGDGATLAQLTNEMLGVQDHLAGVLTATEAEGTQLAGNRAYSLGFTIASAALIGLPLYVDKILR